MNITYTENQAARNPDAYSPSAFKPKLLVQHLQALDRPLAIVQPAPATREDLCRAHDPDYVDGVLAGRLVNGFGNRSLEVAASLPYTSGSLIAAARCALAGDGIVCSPTSGFHHAGWASAEGFCTFNGLAVAALHLRANGLAQRVAVIDCDRHYGNGTEEIVRRLACASWCFTTGRTLQGVEGQRYLDRLEDLLERALAFAPDVILFQAGADVHIDDPLGGVLTTEQMAQRDEMVFAAATRAGIPVAWNLAGGYQRDADGGISRVLDLHVQTFDIAQRWLEEGAALPAG